MDRKKKRSAFKLYLKKNTNLMNIIIVIEIFIKKVFKNQPIKLCGTKSYI